MQIRRRLVLLTFILPLANPVFAADAPAAPAPDPSLAASPAVSTAPDEMTRQLADTKDRLATSLRSYSLLSDENSQLKEAAQTADVDKSLLTEQLASAQRTIAALRLQAAAATQVSALDTQVRELQDQMAVLIAENAKLKIRLALAGPPPAGGMAVPTRPAGN